MSIYFEKDAARGFGTFPLKGEELYAAVKHAFEVGYRAFDTAQIYENEADLGKAFKAISAKREHLFITTKVRNENFAKADFLPSVEKSLKDLDIAKTDMLLLHWPPIGGDIAASVKLLASAQKSGLCNYIGVSNYTIKMMRDAQAMIDVPISCNQVEFHPLLDQNVLLEAANEMGIGLVSYCSVARGEIFKYPLLEEIGKAHGKSGAQIALRWIIQQGVALNTMSTKHKNIQANFDIMDFNLSAEEMAQIDTLTQNGYRIIGKNLTPMAPDWD